MANYSGFFGQLAAHGALNPESLGQSAIERYHDLARWQTNGLSDYGRAVLGCIPQETQNYRLSKEPKTYREELQAEIDNWLM